MAQPILKSYFFGIIFLLRSFNTDAYSILFKVLPEDFASFISIQQHSKEAVTPPIFCLKVLAQHFLFFWEKTITATLAPYFQKVLSLLECHHF